MRKNEANSHDFQCQTPSETSYGIICIADLMAFSVCPLYLLASYLPLTPQHIHKSSWSFKRKDIMYVPIVFWWFWISRNIKRQGQLKTEKFFCILSFNCFLTIGSNSLGLINKIYVVNLWKAWKECRWYCYFKVWIMIWTML